MSCCMKCDLLLYQIQEHDWKILDENERVSAKRIKICPICYSLLDRKSKILEMVKHLCNTIRKVKNVESNI